MWEMETRLGAIEYDATYSDPASLRERLKSRPVLAVDIKDDEGGAVRLMLVMVCDSAGLSPATGRVQVLLPPDDPSSIVGPPAPKS
jgi:hypothetical protein